MTQNDKICQIKMSYEDQSTENAAKNEVILNPVIKSNTQIVDPQLLVFSISFKHSENFDVKRF